MQIHIRKTRIYVHQVMRVNYTTYDMRRNQDSVSPRSHPDIMVLAPDEPDGSAAKHPYKYGRIYGIYHAVVEYSPPGSRSRKQHDIQFLWVRWFARYAPRNGHGGFRRKRHTRIGFLPVDAPGAFGFLDPSLVLRGVHMIPCFNGPRIDYFVGSSFLRSLVEVEADGCEWEYYYVNRLVDAFLFPWY